MNGRFEPARAAFAILAEALRCDSDLADDVLKALDLLLTRYNTQIYENRFIVGGVAERIIAAAFVALGERTRTLGVVVTRTDIRVGDVDLSVKSSFRPRTREIRMVNVLGDSLDATWREPTIFVISDFGIAYADPDLLPNQARRTRDAVVLGMKPLRDLWEQMPQFAVRMNIPYSRDDAAGSDVASRIIADEILRYTKRLKPFDPRQSWE